MVHAGFSIRRLTSAASLLLVVGGLGLSAAPASAAVDQFRLVGGSRYTLTVSKQTQLPGVDPAIWPKGYRYLCSSTGPSIGFRITSSPPGDVEAFGTVVAFAPRGTLNYKPWGTGGLEARWFLTTGQLPRRDATTISLEDAMGSQPASARLSPKLGLYDLKIMPLKTIEFVGVTYPAAVLSAILDVRQGSAAECPAPTAGNLPRFFRASA